MTIAGSVVWVILLTISPATLECEAKTGHNDIASTKDHSTVSHVDEDDAMKAAVVAGTVYRPSVPVSTMDCDGNRVLDNREANHEKITRVLLRERRTLTFPSPSTILLIFGLGTPLQLDRESVIVGAFAKMIYALPVNSTDFTEPGVHFSRTKSRWSIYKVLERAAELYGFGAGKSCFLRAICDVAAAPFDLHHGLFGQMVQSFLSPSSTSEPYDEYTDREYHAAESLGKHVGENCHALYPECERSLLDVFSTTASTLEEATTSTSSSD